MPNNVRRKKEWLKQHGRLERLDLATYSHSFNRLINYRSGKSLSIEEAKRAKSSICTKKIGKALTPLDYDLPIFEVMDDAPAILKGM